MTSPAPSVTVMIGPAADDTTPPETGDRWPKQARHTPQMDRLRMRGEELAVAAPARPSGRDGVMASPPPPYHRRYTAAAAVAAGRCWSCISARADSVPPRSHTCMTKLSTVPYAYASGLIARLLGVALEAVDAFGVRLLRI
jgi:hypothetical protein